VKHVATAQQQAYVYLQDQIVSGSLPSGARINVEAIAETLGVSRMPVREAIRQLDAEGHITIRPNRGAVVTSRTHEEVVELFEIRAALEGLAMRLAARHATRDAIEDLKLELARLRRLQTNNEAWVARHDQFHDLMCQLGRRPQLCAEIRRIRLVAAPYIRLYTKLHSSPEIKGYEHEHIIRALQGGDAERAERVMRAHIMVNAEAIAACLPAAGEKAKRRAANGAGKRSSRAPARRRQNGRAGAATARVSA
jgi:DNA-binding GntR family transcriptional regulator